MLKNPKSVSDMQSSKLRPVSAPAGSKAFFLTSLFLALLVEVSIINPLCFLKLAQVTFGAS